VRPNAPKPPTEEQVGVIKDIRWLANEGYVIEYSDGMVFLGVQGEPAAKKEGPRQTRRLLQAEPTESACGSRACGSRTALQKLQWKSPWRKKRWQRRLKLRWLNLHGKNLWRKKHLPGNIQN
jgi:hypothetical protein